MARLAIALAGLLLAPAASQDGRSLGGLDRTRAFFAPDWARADPPAVLIETSAGGVDAATYLRYLGARLGRRHLEDLAFDIVLARECETRKLARSAPRLARSLAARRLAESGRSAADDPDATMQRRFANEALRQLRIDALVNEDRAVDEDELRLFFERHYGIGGEYVVMRHVLVSFSMTRRRLERAGESPDDAVVESAALARAVELRRRLEAGARFDELLAESDDRTTRRMLQDPGGAAKAGLVSAYDQQRYGAGFCEAVKALAVGEVSAPVRSRIGFHLVLVSERKVTRFEDVADELRRRMTGGKATPMEAMTLRERLFEKYGVRIGG